MIVYLCAGLVLAAWLVNQRGLSPQAASDVVTSAAQAAATSRRVDVEALKAFLAAC